MAAAEGSIAMEQFQEDKIKDPKIREFMKKVPLETDPQFMYRYPGALGAHVEIYNKDGSSWREESIYPKGHLQNPMTVEEVRENFVASPPAHSSRDKRKRSFKTSMGWKI
jgi:2-methylcitrate dehydratase PrpD